MHSERSTGSTSREHRRRRAERVLSFHWASAANQWRCPVGRCPVERCQAGRRTSPMARRRANGSKERTRPSGAGGRSPAACSASVPLGIGLAFSMPGLLPRLTMPNATMMHLSPIGMPMTFVQHMCTHAHKRAARIQRIHAREAPWHAACGMGTNADHRSGASITGAKGSAEDADADADASRRRQRQR